MKSFVVFGMGRFGSSLAKQLFSQNNEVLVIDKNEDKIQEIAEHVTHAVTADGTSEEVLRSLGVRNFDCAVVAFSEDIQASVLITMMLKEIGVGLVISKAKSDIHKRLLEKVGADRVTFPERDMAIKLGHSMNLKNVLDFIEISEKYSIFEFYVPKKWIGHTIIDLRIRSVFEINILAIRRAVKGKPEDLIVSPVSDFSFVSGDIILAIGTINNLIRLSEMK